MSYLKGWSARCLSLRRRRRLPWVADDSADFFRFRLYPHATKVTVNSYSLTLIFVAWVSLLSRLCRPCIVLLLAVVLLQEALALVLARDAHRLAEALRSTPLRRQVRRVGCLIRRPCLDLGFHGGKACHAPAPGPMLLLPGRSCPHFSLT